VINVIELIHDDGKEIGNSLWIEDAWEEHVAQIFTPELNELILKIHNATHILRTKIIESPKADFPIGNTVTQDASNWDKRILDFINIKKIASRGNKKQFKVFVRDVFLNEKNIIANREPICAGLLDFVVSVFYSTNIVLKNKQKPIFVIPNFDDPIIALWWKTLALLTQKELGLPVNSFILK
jgi:hypothetical protein